ncbi:MAG: DUF4421 family protein [Bacteroidia bacterium]
MRTLVFIVLLCAQSYHCVGYNVLKKDTAIFRIDTTYIKTFKTKFGIKPKLKTGSLSTRYGTRYNYVKTTSYAPLVPNLTLTYKNFDLSFSINAFRTLFKEYTYAASKLTDFSFNYYRKKLVLEVVLRNNEGFYTRVNARNYIGKLTKSSYSFTQAELDAGLNFNCVINAKHFSYKAAFYNSARQLKSCGSLIFTGVLRGNSQSISSGKTIVPLFNSTKLQAVETASNVGTLSVYPRAGYAYTYVRNSFYASGAAFTELWRPIQQWTYYNATTKANTIEQRRYWYVKNSIHLQSGFNWQKWYVGLAYNTEVAKSSWHNVPIRKASYNFAIMGGYRIINYYNPNKK